MTDERSKELVALLRALAKATHPLDYGHEFRDAADELERLRERWTTAEKQWRVEADHHRAVESECATKDAEIARLQEALKPLAELASKVPAAAPDAWTVLVTVGALRRAAEVLK